jgi:hypothetical protein
LGRCAERRQSPNVPVYGIRSHSRHNSYRQSAPRVALRPKYGTLFWAHDWKWVSIDDLRARSIFAPTSATHAEVSRRQLVFPAAFALVFPLQRSDMLLGDRSDASHTTPALRFATHMTENCTNARMNLSRSQTVAHLVVGQNVAGADNHTVTLVGKAIRHFPISADTAPLRENDINCITSTFVISDAPCEYRERLSFGMKWRRGNRISSFQHRQRLTIGLWP